MAIDLGQVFPFEPSEAFDMLRTLLYSGRITHSLPFILALHHPDPLIGASVSS